MGHDHTLDLVGALIDWGDLGTLTTGAVCLRTDRIFVRRGARAPRIGWSHAAASLTIMVTRGPCAGQIREFCEPGGTGMAAMCSQMITDSQEERLCAPLASPGRCPLYVRTPGLLYALSCGQPRTASVHVPNPQAAPHSAGSASMTLHRPRPRSPQPARVPHDNRLSGQCRPFVRPPRAIRPREPLQVSIGIGEGTGPGERCRQHRWE